MIVSALLTAVAINLGLCVLLFVLYSVLRKQPGNANVYAPRLLAQRRSGFSIPSSAWVRRGGFSVDRLLPSPGWVRHAWLPSEDELLEACGLDAVVFMRIFIFSLRVFSVAGLIGIFVLVPVNYLGDQLTDIDFTNLPNKSLDLFSISNVKDGSNRLWVHFGAAYVITGVVCYMLYYEYNYISSKRVAYFIMSKLQPHQFTILVRGIPVHDGTTVSETVYKFFTEYHPSTYMCHIVVRRASKLRGLITDAKNLYCRLKCLKSRPHASQNSSNMGLLGLFRGKVDLADHHSKLTEALKHNVRQEQSDASPLGELLNVYLPKYETGGQFWPTVHNSTIFALILMQAILIGIFVLKKLPLASSLVLPLPVLTLLFNEYCRKRFLPIFYKFSAEALIKKDRENQNDPNFNEIYHKLVGAYHDPDLIPISDTVSIDEQTAPLLSSTEG